jgi:hypothetical protein
MLGCGGVGFDGFGGGTYPVEPGFEDGVDRRVTDGVDGKCPLTGRFQPITFIAARQSDDTHGGAITLFGMRTRAHHSFHQDGGVTADARSHLD